MLLADCSATERAQLGALEQRIGHDQVRRRLGLEREPRRGRHALHPANWLTRHSLIRAGLNLAGVRARGRRNTLDIQRRDNEVRLAGLPAEFDGYTLLHLSDMHLDVGGQFVDHLMERVQGLRFDACVLTGDFRFRSHGPYHGALDALARLRPRLGERVLAVLGNHDTIRMVAGIEALGIAVLMNESVRIERAGAGLSLVGIDDAHYFRTHDLQRAAAGVPPGACSVLLSHTPEPYRLAARAGHGLMLCGHTHGGQICLPGGVPILTDTGAPRAFTRGAWHYRGMAGYTSVGCGSSIVDVRLNCLPEITLHRLRRA